MKVAEIFIVQADLVQIHAVADRKFIIYVDIIDKR